MTTQKKALFSIYTIGLALMLSMFTNTTIAYIIASYAAKGVDPTAVLQLVSLPAIFGIAASILIGPIAMKVNKKWLTAFCTLCVFIYFMIFAFVGSDGPFSALLVAVLFGGIAQGIAYVLASTMIGEYVPPEKSSVYVAIGMAMINGGLVLANIIGGSIASGNGGADWPKSYLIGFAIIPLLIIFLVFMPRKPDTPADAHGGFGDTAAVPSRLPVKVIAIALLSAFVAIFICGFIFFVSIYIVDYFKLGTSFHAGLANSLFTIAGVVAGFTYAIWAKLFKNALIIVAYFAIAVSLFVMLGFNTTLMGVYIAAILCGWGFNLMLSYVTGYVMQITPPKLAPVGVALFQVGNNIGMAIAVTVLNFLGNALSGVMGGYMQGILIATGIGMLACAVAAGFVFRPLRAHSEAA